MFVNQRFVTVIGLRKNEIKHVSSNAFASCYDLESLDLSQNRLASISEGSFSHLQNLYSLDLSNNYISVIHYDVFPKNFRLTELNLLGNRLSCSCRQMTALFLIRVGNLIVSCIKDDPSNLPHPYSGMITYSPHINYSSRPPAYLSMVTELWSQWASLPSKAVPGQDIDAADCRYGVSIRKRKCISCSLAHRPWCVVALPSLQTKQTCATLHIKRSRIPRATFCQFVGCPKDRSFVNFSDRSINMVESVSHVDYCTWQSKQNLTMSEVKVAVIACSALALVCSAMLLVYRRCSRHQSLFIWDP